MRSCGNQRPGICGVMVNIKAQAPRDCHGWLQPVVSWPSSSPSPGDAEPRLQRTVLKTRSMGGRFPGLLRPQRLSKTQQVLWNHANDAAAGAIHVGDEEERDGYNQREENLQKRWPDAFLQHGERFKTNQ
jgi:hypothetical protein